MPFLDVEGTPKWLLGSVVFGRPGAPRPKKHTCLGEIVAVWPCGRRRQGQTVSTPPPSSLRARKGQKLVPSGRIRLRCAPKTSNILQKAKIKHHRAAASDFGVPQNGRAPPGPLRGPSGAPPGPPPGPPQRVLGASKDPQRVLGAVKVPQLLR